MSRANLITSLVLILIVVILAATVFYVRQHAEEEKKFSSPAGEALASIEASFNDLLGEPVELFSAGSGITVAYAWASWCPQCRSDLQTLDFIAKKYQDRDVAVIAINRNEPPATAERFLQQLNISDAVTIVIDNNDQYYESINAYAMPELVLFNEAGQEVLRQRGALQIAPLEQSVEGLLQEDR